MESEAENPLKFLSLFTMSVCLSLSKGPVNISSDVQRWTDSYLQRQWVVFIWFMVSLGFVVGRFSNVVGRIHASSKVAKVCE